MNLWDKLQNAQAYVVARVRAGIMAVALAFGFYSKELAEAIGNDAWTRRIKIAAVLLAMAAMTLRAGEKNAPVAAPQPEGQPADLAGLAARESLK